MYIFICIDMLVLTHLKQYILKPGNHASKVEHTGIELKTIYNERLSKTIINNILCITKELIDIMKMEDEIRATTVMCVNQMIPRYEWILERLPMRLLFATSQQERYAEAWYLRELSRADDIYDMYIKQCSWKLANIRGYLTDIIPKHYHTSYHQNIDSMHVSSYQLPTKVSMSYTELIFP